MKIRLFSLVFRDQPHQFELECFRPTEYVGTMSFAEIKEQIAELTPDQRLEIAALIAHLGRHDDVQYKEELDRRLAAMDDGSKASAEEFGRMHDGLSAEGR